MELHAYLITPRHAHRLLEVKPTTQKAGYRIRPGAICEFSHEEKVIAQP